MADAEDRRTVDDIMAVARALAGRGRDAAGVGAEALGAGVDDAVRALVDRRIQRALRPAAPAVTSAEVIEALGGGRGSSLANRLGTGATARLARRTRVARSVAGRSPVGLALRFGPALVDVITGSLRGLDAAAAHLVTRAREHRVEPDPDRLRAVLVQALVGDDLDPDADVDHASLARVWLGDAGRRMVPFGIGSISGLTRGRTPEAVAAALGRVDVGRLGTRRRRRS